jgi:copper chaperone CopZ
MLMRTTALLGVGVLALAALCLTQAAAQTSAKQTVITIEDLDCPTCAKVVEKAVAKVKGVHSVKTDVEKQTATVTPSDSGTTLSVKELWEAVESAGFKPTKLEGPSGTYTAKPAS